MGLSGKIINISGKKWVKTMLIGEYNHTVDTKGRVSVPAKFRNELGDLFVMCKALDKCLWVYPLEKWEKVSSQIQSLPMSKNATRFSRLILGSASECSPDKQGRINIPMSLRQYANINKDVTIVGLSSKIEIWDSELWDKFNEEECSDMAEVAEAMGELGIMV